MRFTLEIASKAVCAKHLQRAEQHKMAQHRHKIIFRDAAIRLQRLQVSVNQFVTQIRRISRFGLPQKRGDIIINRAAPTSLKINQIRFAIFQHHVACLKIAIEKRIGLILKQIACHSVEIVLQTQLIEIDFERFQKTVFEIVEVERYHARIERRLRITDREIELFGTAKLHCGQQCHRFVQQRFFVGRVGSRFAPMLQCIEQRHRPQILLQIAREVVGAGINFGYRQTLRPEVARQNHKSAIFGLRFAPDGNAGAWLPVQTIVTTVATRLRQRFDAIGGHAESLLI